MSTLNDRIREVGLEIFEEIRRDVPTPLNMAWWQNRLLHWCMQHPKFKTELFRFVDELPSLRTDEQIASHLREHFAGTDDDFPESLRWLTSSVSPDSLTAHVVGGVTRYNVSQLARQFIGAASIKEAEPAFRLLRRKGFAFTIDLVGEAAFTMAEADVYHRNYLDALDHLAKICRTWPALPAVGAMTGKVHDPVNISVKLSSLYPRISPLQEERTLERLFERMVPILDKAKAIGATVYIDMESYPLKNLTLALFERIITHQNYRDMQGLGIVLQAYLRDTEHDLLHLRDVCKDRGVPVWVRLVKGAYWDQEVIQARQNGWQPPVWLRKELTDANYEKLAALLLDNIKYLTPAFATHNIRTICACMAMAETRLVTADRFEFQTLYGMANPIKEAVLKRSYRMRQYLPVGDLLPGMAYLVRRLLENTANDAFVAQTFLAEADPAHLLRAPLPSQPEKPLPRHAFENEPMVAFHLPWGKDEWVKELKKLESGLPVTLRSFTSVKAAGYEKDERPDPNDTSRILYRAENLTVDTVDAVMDTAANGLLAWSALSVEERSAVLKKAVPIMRRRKLEIFARLALEVGKRVDESDGEFAEAIDFINFYCDAFEELAKDAGCRSLPGEENRLYLDPVGVAVVIAPWNFSLSIPVGMISAALVCGNSVVFKPSKQSAWIGLLIGEVFHEAGVPADALQVILGKGSTVGMALVEHPATGLIAFTGSREVGLAITRAAAEVKPGQDHVKRVVCEMGGKNVIYVDADADLDAALPAIVKSAFGYQGQKCSACSIAMVHESVWDRVVERLAPAFRDMEQGPSGDLATDIGPMIDADAYKRLEGWRADLKKYLLAENAVPEALRGYYIPASVYGPIPLDHELLTTELFGPLLALVPMPG
ncbi:MAG: proline dehydrogenase family protein, partial [Nitrospirota bacterium]|nr:proline dehydrogenase family protein [Nitrospirota bacterium]